MIDACLESPRIQVQKLLKFLPEVQQSYGALQNLLKMILDDIEKVMEPMLAPMTSLQHRIWASTCVVAYHGDVDPNYIVSRDQFISPLGMTDEMECL